MLDPLPEKYYLAHAQELFDFVGLQCDHLLDDAHRQYLDSYAQLDQDSQCLLIRFLSRKPTFLRRSSLEYAELSSCSEAIANLIHNDFIAPVHTDDWLEFLPVLTKAQLLNCLVNAQVHAKSSTAKAELLKLAKSCSKAEQNWGLSQQFLVRKKQDVIDYILFLFFGDLRNRLQKFAMRDLGVLRTRKKQASQVARFDCKNEAQSAFQLQTLRKRFKLDPKGVKESTAEYLLNQPAVGPVANKLSDTLLLEVGSQYISENPAHAIALWRASNDPLATQKWIRSCYTHGDREALKLELNNLRNKELDAASKIFIEDFYARKFEGKRTSVYTDMLRETTRKLHVDEVYLNDVEEGVIQQYRTQGQTAIFTENKLWRVLFAFTFWDLLYNQHATQSSEFDHLPLSLKRGHFYDDNHNAIEQRLQQLDNRSQTLKQFTHLAAQHYGSPTGLFRWSPRLMDALIPCLQFSPNGSIAFVLRRMAQDFEHCKDGYPDIMVVDQQQLWFEEIKAPGDSLRPNQLVSINRLRNAGFEVEIAQVSWAVDANQTYAVVDIETTGGRKGGNAITEIAVVKVRDQEIVSEWSSLVNPRRHVPAYITQLTGIDNAMVTKAPTFSELADELEEQLDNCIFVAHNVGFDYGFIKAAYEALNRPFRKPKYCTVKNTRKAFPGLKSYSLGNLTRHFDIDLDNHHRALSDARATADLLRLIQDATQRSAYASAEL